MKTFKIFFEQTKNCPKATYDLHTNLANRQKAIDEYFYGPANPDMPEDYWQKAARRWGIDVKTAESMKCENCAAFDISDQMRDCISNGIRGEEDFADTMATINKSDLGYCNFLHFKCAGTRSCTAWVTGGAVDNKDRTNA